MKFYLDTNIWIDYFENRSDGLRPLGEFAFQFLKKVVETNSVIYYSDLVKTELNKVLTKKVIDPKFNDIPNLVYVEFTKEDYFFAKKNSFHTQYTSC